LFFDKEFFYVRCSENGTKLDKNKRIEVIHERSQRKIEISKYSENYEKFFR
jgi:hypothetical protein